MLWVLRQSGTAGHLRFEAACSARCMLHAATGSAPTPYGHVKGVPRCTQVALKQTNKGLKNAMSGMGWGFSQPLQVVCVLIGLAGMCRGAVSESTVYWYSVTSTPQWIRQPKPHCIFWRLFRGPSTNDLKK
jgi:hypothetical protein